MRRTESVVLIPVLRKWKASNGNTAGGRLPQKIGTSIPSALRDTRALFFMSVSSNLFRIHIAGACTLATVPAPEYHQRLRSRNRKFLNYLRTMVSAPFPFHQRAHSFLCGQHRFTSNRFGGPRSIARLSSPPSLLRLAFERRGVACQNSSTNADKKKSSCPESHTNTHTHTYAHTRKLGDQRPRRETTHFSSSSCIHIVRACTIQVRTFQSSSDCSQRNERDGDSKVGVRACALGQPSSPLTTNHLPHPRQKRACVLKCSTALSTGTLDREMTK